MTISSIVPLGMNAAAREATVADKETMAVNSKFSRWATSYGATRIAGELTKLGPATQVTFSAVYSWIRGEYEPRGPKIRALIRLSNGSVTHRDIQDHFAKAAAARDQVQV